MHQQGLIERAIGVRHKRPGHAVDPRQARQRWLHQYRQALEIVGRQALIHLFELGLQQMKVLQQPFGSRADVVPGARLAADIRIHAAQALDVVLQAGGKTLPVAALPDDLVRQPEADAVPLKALHPEHLGPDRRVQRAGIQAECGPQAVRHLLQYLIPTGRRHALRRQGETRPEHQHRDHHKCHQPHAHHATSPARSAV